MMLMMMTIVIKLAVIVISTVWVSFSRKIGGLR